MNPASIMQFLNAKNNSNSPILNFLLLLKICLYRALRPAALSMYKSPDPDGTTVTANMRVQESDLKLLEGLKDLASMK